MVKAEIDAIFAEEFCQDLLAPVKTAYEDEKAPSARHVKQRQILPPMGKIWKP